MTERPSDLVPLSLRLTTELRAKVEALAKRGRRSLNSELIAAVEHWVSIQTPPQSGASLRMPEGLAAVLEGLGPAVATIDAAVAEAGRAFEPANANVAVLIEAGLSSGAEPDPSGLPPVERAIFQERWAVVMRYAREIEAKSGRGLAHALRLIHALGGEARVISANEMTKSPEFQAAAERERERQRERDEMMQLIAAVREKLGELQEAVHARDAQLQMLMDERDRAEAREAKRQRELEEFERRMTEREEAAEAAIAAREQSSAAPTRTTAQALEDAKQGRTGIAPPGSTQPTDEAVRAARRGRKPKG